jgi:hypothetical protein
MLTSNVAYMCTRSVGHSLGASSVVEVEFSVFAQLRS